MSHGRNLNWLNDRRIIYRRDPINDIPTIETRQYCYYENGTYECYNLFASKAKITTYKSLKWHMLVLFYLNQDHDYSSSPFFENVAKFMANLRSTELKTIAKESSKNAEELFKFDLLR